MNRPIARPTPAQLRQMAKSSMDPTVSQALRDLADEYERSAQAPAK